MRNPNLIDLWFTHDGDYQVDSNGDLKDTSSEYERSLVQEIRTRTMASTGDWKLTPTLAANVDSFLGNAATDVVLKNVAESIRNVLTIDNLLTPRDFDVSFIRVSSSIVMYRVTLSTPAGDLFVHLGYNTDHKKFMGY